MNSSSSEELPAPNDDDPITDENFIAINKFLDVIRLVISLAGMITNALSIRAFLVLGIKDGIAVSLVGLSLSDFGYTTCSFFVSSGSIVHLMELEYGIDSLPVHPKWVFGVFGSNVTHIFNEITCLTTTFLGVARSMCVVMPFRVKNIFTVSKSFSVLITFALIALASHLPVLCLMGTQVKFDSAVNRTRVVLWISTHRAIVKNVAFIFHYTVLSLVSTAVVSVCVLIMAKYLRRSLKFRVKTSTGDEARVEKLEAADTKLSGKELQAVRQVLLICVLYTVSVIPGLFHALYRSVNEDFDVGKRLSNSYIVTGAVRTVFNLLNSSTTFFVYYAYNRRFRAVCLSTNRAVGVEKIDCDKK